MEILFPVAEGEFFCLKPPSGAFSSVKAAIRRAFREKVRVFLVPYGILLFVFLLVL